MNRFPCFLLATIAASLLANALAAQDGPPTVGQRPADSPGEPARGLPRGPGPGFRMPPFPLLETLDADQDGKLSKEEIDNAVAALKKLDQNGDGKLSKEEIGWPPAGLGRREPSMRRAAPDFAPGGFPAVPGANFVERIMSHDKDRDGKVTKDELPERMRWMMQRLDANQDGAIDKGEAEAEAAAPPAGRRSAADRGSDPGTKPPNERPTQPAETLPQRP